MDKPTVIQISSLFLGRELKEENLISWKLTNDLLVIKVKEGNGAIMIYKFGMIFGGPAKDNSETNFNHCYYDFDKDC